ncbi:Decaprenyl diphosphate synthase-like [Arabidopsis thaliana x Arabidopsis arenosa]|uniref:Alkyl transferase n=1 Tax=Arabidopsis thaliana x Arabidopsis arenosa TaxID=1240361 RepID=A0A8T2FSB0_9BRAS|nr:Decaprenyl diphosphate synthase-like [Arabidopsis thaliana x Arabidopsis arenosa]
MTEHNKAMSAAKTDEEKASIKTKRQNTTHEQTHRQLKENLIEHIWQKWGLSVVDLDPIRTSFCLGDRVPTKLKKAIMQAREDKKLTQSQLAQNTAHVAGLTIFQTTRYIGFPVFLLKLIGLIKIKAARDNEKRDEGTYVVREDGLQRELMPRHVAFILDGNRRWAKRAGLTTSQGHEAGAKRLIDIAELCFELGVHTVSAFAFSTENWGRDKIEIDNLMSLIQHYRNKSNIKFFHRSEVRVSVIGNKTKIPESLLKEIHEIEEATKGYKNKHLIMAVDYSGKFDIMHACKILVKKSEKGLIREEDVDEALIERELLTNCSDFPSPDLMIRTSGEQRISNFFLWQLAYSELFFSPVFWPDFDKDKLLEALASYQRRERRFGCRV